MASCTIVHCIVLLTLISQDYLRILINNFDSYCTITSMMPPRCYEDVVVQESYSSSDVLDGRQYDVTPDGVV